MRISLLNTRLGFPKSPVALQYIIDRYKDAVAAYSVRRLSLTSTDAIRVRRSSDDAEQDIGFDGSDLDTASLLTFAGAGDAFVTTWYDQTGNGNNATQTTAASQPKIVDAGTLVTKNGKPALDFDGVDDSMTILSDISPSVSNYTVLMVFNMVSGRFFDSLTGRLVFQDTPSNYSYFDGSVQGDHFTLNSQILATLELVGGTSTSNVYENGSIKESNLDYTQKAISGETAIGAEYDGVGKHGDKITQELIIYPSDQSSNRTSIEQNINDYYGIY